MVARLSRQVGHASRQPKRSWQSSWQPQQPWQKVALEVVLGPGSLAVCVRAMDMELKVKRKVQVCLEVRAGVSALSVVSWKLWWSAQNMRKRCPLTPVLIETSVSGAHRRLFSGRDASPGACTECKENYLLVWSVYRVCVC